MASVSALAVVPVHGELPRRYHHEVDTQVVPPPSYLRVWDGEARKTRVGGRLRLRLAWDVAQNPFRLSSRMVTGPWFTMATSIMARKTPSAT